MNDETSTVGYADSKKVEDVTSTLRFETINAEDKDKSTVPFSEYQYYMMI